MKKKEKRMILILIIVSILIIGIIWLVVRNRNTETTEPENTVKEEFVQVLDDGTKLNISSKLQEEKDLDGLKIGNIQLTNKDGQSVLLADVTNNTSKDTDVFLIDIILYDKTGKEIATVPGIVSPIKVGEKVQLNAGVTDDYANAYDFKVVKK